MLVLTVTLSDELAEGLQKLAAQEYRSPEQQATAIIHQELLKQKLLTTTKQKKVTHDNQENQTNQ